MKARRPQAGHRSLWAVNDGSTSAPVRRNAIITCASRPAAWLLWILQWSVLPGFAQSDPVNWDPRFSYPGISGIVFVITQFKDGVYVGGGFSQAEEVRATNIARWDGTQWHAVGEGISGGPFPVVQALAVVGAQLVVAGSFQKAGGLPVSNIARWNGSTWSGLGGGLNGTVWALATDGTNLYAGGQFTGAGGVSANHIAKWDGTNWSPLGAGVTEMVYTEQGYQDYGGVYALVSSGNDLYVGGNFSKAGGADAANVARWNSTGWQPLGTRSRFGGVNVLSIQDGRLYAGGSFRLTPGVLGPPLAVWNGTDWDGLGQAEVEGIQAIAFRPDGLYAGGPNLYRWDSTNWSTVGGGLHSTGDTEGAVRAVQSIGNELWVGGDFQLAGTTASRSLARWDGAGYHGFASGGLGVAGPIYVLARLGEEIYAGGSFLQAGGILTTNLAKWDGTKWSSVGWSGAPVWWLFSHADRLYARDDYGSNAPLYRLESNTWKPFDLRSNGDVRKFASNGKWLYAGGVFTTIGGIAATNIARWDGTNWSAVGVAPWPSTPFNSWWNIAFKGDEVFVNYPSNDVNSVSHMRFAHWDGATWQLLEDKIYPWASTCMAVYRDELYVGGTFDPASNILTNGFARWTGTQWVPVTNSPVGSVFKMLVEGSAFYVLGFDAFNRQAVGRWDGARWNVVATAVSGNSGFSPPVIDFAVSGRDIYWGGAFDWLDTLQSHNFAVYHMPGWLRLERHSNGTVLLSWPELLGPVQVQAASQLAAPVWNLLSDGAVATNGRFTITNDILRSSQFYRVKPILGLP